MSAPRVLTSTTSHKAEPLLPTLEVFARLGLRDIDLNLHHILEFGTPCTPGVRSVYRWYFNRVLPRIGQLVSQHGAAYGYLPASVGAFAEAAIGLMLGLAARRRNL